MMRIVLCCTEDLACISVMSVISSVSSALDDGTYRHFWIVLNDALIMPCFANIHHGLELAVTGWNSVLLASSPSPEPKPWTASLPLALEPRLFTARTNDAKEDFHTRLARLPGQVPTHGSGSSGLVTVDNRDHMASWFGPLEARAPNLGPEPLALASSHKPHDSLASLSSPCMTMHAMRLQSRLVDLAP